MPKLLKEKKIPQCLKKNSLLVQQESDMEEREENRKTSQTGSSNV